MCNYKTTQRLVRFVLAIFSFALLGFIASCTTGRFQDSDIQSAHANSSPRETPVPLLVTRENQGRRCNGYYLGNVKEGDENYDPVCYKLQVKLITAAKGGDLVAIRKALSDGAGTEGVYDESYPALQQAASHGRADAVILLLDNGANVNRVADFENTPLNSAASEGRMEVIRVLLARGADVCHGGKGHTAGDIARSRGFKEVADLLKTAESQRCK